MSGLADLKKAVLAHEMKIDDLEQECKDCTNKKEKKDMEKKLKELKEDKKYLDNQKKVEELEKEEEKAAERKAITATPKKAAAAKEADPKKTKEPEGLARQVSGPGEEMDAEQLTAALETVLKSGAGAKEFVKSLRKSLGGSLAVIGETGMMAKIDAAFDGKGKDAAALKANGIVALQAMAFATPFVLPRLQKLLDLLQDSKLGQPAQAAACAILEQVSPKGHGVAGRAVPMILKAMDSKQWKVKAGSLALVSPCLKQMVHVPAALGLALPQILPRVADCAKEVRAEVRDGAKAVLNEIGELVQSQEIRKLSKDIVQALAEPTNQKYTQGVLAALSNQTFMSYMDAASLALLYPIIVRGLKEREPMSKKWSAQIFGSTVTLAKDVAYIKPYLSELVPLLKKTLLEPMPEAMREAAKAFGMIEQGMPEYSREHIQPWLFQLLTSGEEGGAIGAAQGVSEVLLKMQKDRVVELVPEIKRWAMSEENKPVVHNGFMELMDAMPQCMKMDFVPFILELFPAMLMGVRGEDKNDVAVQASKAMTARFGDLAPDLLLPCFEECYLANMPGAREGKVDDKVAAACRQNIASLLAQMAEKILEHKRFGQDLLTCEDCFTEEGRKELKLLIFLQRFDADPAVKRVANAAWKTCGGAPKVQKALSPEFASKTLAPLRRGEKGAGAKKAADTAFAELVKTKDLEEEKEGAEEAKAAAEPKGFAFAPRPRNSAEEGESASALIVQGKPPSSMAGTERQTSGASEPDGLAADLFQKFAGEVAMKLPREVAEHMDVVAISTCGEMLKRGMGKRLTKSLEAFLVGALEGCPAAAVEAVTAELPIIAEAAAREALGDKFDKAAGEEDDADAEVLLHVDDFMLMYGGGHLLLKDTTLDLKANRRYGVVAHNGAGKTTLMKEIAAHRVMGMPASLSVVHMSDENLNNMKKSSLDAKEWVMTTGRTDEEAKKCLGDIGIPEKEWSLPVAEMSVGLRMRLELGKALVGRHADIVLLDEPTNHLDADTVQWLIQFIRSLQKSSVMVISHEPSFLNAICTDIISYKDRRLVYTKGNFDAFVAAKGIKAEDIEALLSGNLCLDTDAAPAAPAAGEEGGEQEEGRKKSKEGEDSEGEKKEDDKAELLRRASTASLTEPPRAGPPKLSFPIPGPLEGVKSSSKTVVEAKNVSFRYNAGKEYTLRNVNCKLSLGSRVAIAGKNGSGKSTLLGLLASQMSPTEGKEGELGEVYRHHNLRLAYMAQDHLKTLGPYFDTSPLVYFTERFANGYDEELQKKLMEPEDAEEAARIATLAKEFGKYGNPVETLLGRSKQGAKIVYDVKWAGMDDPKQNTVEPLEKLRKMGLDKMCIACDERIAAKAAGLDKRPLTRREIVKHVEAFGIDEEMCCNRQIRGFSAGQKVRLSLAAMFWTKPHVICLDEPTNYLDVETVDALAKALKMFRGGVVMISPVQEFSDRVCNEAWNLENGELTASKLENGNKRVA